MWKGSACPTSIANGMDLGGLLPIEYAHYLTLIATGVIAATWFLTVVWERTRTVTSERQEQTPAASLGELLAQEEADWW